MDAIKMIIQTEENIDIHEQNFSKKVQMTILDRKFEFLFKNGKKTINVRNMIKSLLVALR